MNEYVENPPFVALIDDDPHSAHLLSRMLAAAGAPEIRYYGDAREGGIMLADAFGGPASGHPAHLVIDLKAHSQANRDFLLTIRPLLHRTGLEAVVMAQTSDPLLARSLHEAGAAAVFIRHAELEAYRRQAADIVGFWARDRRLEAIGM